MNNFRFDKLPTRGLPAREPVFRILHDFQPCADLAIILTNWDTTNQTADLNDDGLVDAADMGILFAGWGPCD